VLDGIFPRKTTAEWLQELNGADILATEVVAHQAEPAPEFGQHTEEVLLELGYSWEEIGTLRDTGVV